MQLTRTETIEGMIEEYGVFVDLVAGLDEAEWTKASRCDGFEVRHVAGHVIGLAEDVVAGRPGSRNAEEEAASVIDDTPAVASGRLRTALDQLRPLAAVFDDDDAWNGPSGVPDLTMGAGVLTLWFDTYVHADDIRAAIGREPVAGDGQRAALAYLETHLTTSGWGPATIDLGAAAGESLVIGADAGGPTVAVAPHDFVLAATGRLDPGPLGLDPSVNIYAE